MKLKALALALVARLAVGWKGASPIGDQLEECPVPAELQAAFAFPNLREAPYTGSPLQLREPFRKQISDNDGQTFVELFGDGSPVSLFAVRNRRVFVHGKSLQTGAFVRKVLRDAVATDGRWSADFCHDATDNTYFINSELRSQSSLICISQTSMYPSYFPVLGFPDRYYQRTLKTKISHTGIPWKDKKAKIFWSGSLDGPSELAREGLFSLPRVQAYQLAQAGPSLWDFGFTEIDEQLTDRYRHGDWAADEKDFLQNLKFQPPRDFATELPRFRNLLNLEGVVCAFRMHELFRSGSVVLQPMGSTQQFFFRDLTPWTHFAPYEDLADIPTIVADLEANPALAERIAAAGKDYAERHLTLNGQNCFVNRFLEFVANRTAYNLASPDELLELGFRDVTRPPRDVNEE